MESNRCWDCDAILTSGIFCEEHGPEKNMGDVTEIHKDTLFYIKGDQEQFIGVGDSSGLGRIEFINKKDNVSVHADGVGIIRKVKFKELCVAWLALNYPDSLKFDVEEK